MDNCKFVGADLTGARFIGASLSHADLTGADLVDAHFTGADLSFSNLNEESLKKLGAITTGANFRTVKPGIPNTKKIKRVLKTPNTKQ
jgi:uncharacterized protein YjbI with pentapeptide repeats